MTVDAVIVSFNTKELLRDCLASIRVHATPVEVHVTVVDNASRDGSPEMVAAEFPEVELVTLDENIGFGGGNNRGAERGDAPFILFLNSDAELREGALSTLAAVLEEDEGRVVVGPRLLNPDGSFQLSCRRFPSLLRNLWCFSGMVARFPDQFHGLQNWLTEEEHRDGIKVDMVSGACFLARRDYFESLGGFDENLFLYEEEMDISYPSRKRGLEVCYCAKAQVLHHGGASVDASEMSEFATRHMFRSKYYAFRKHHGHIYAWLCFAGDQMNFGLSSFLGRIRREPSQATETLRQCRQAWRDSFLSAAELRELNR
jgi:GT2 family glycosyltransferase